MIKETDVYKIGVLNKPHGVKGEMSFTFTDDVWDRAEADYLICMVDGILVPFFLDEYRFRSEHSALVKFRGLNSCEAVQEMSGWEVYFPHALTPRDEPEEYTWQYFTGFCVEDVTAGPLGVIDRVEDSTTNVLFQVGDRLLPAAEELIEEVDHTARLVRMNLPEGLLEL